MDAFSQKIVQARFYAGERYCNLSLAWVCPWSEIADYPITPVSTVHDDQWVVPIEWVSPSVRTKAERTIDFTRYLPKLDIYDHEAFKRRLKRLAVLDRFQTLRHEGRSLPAPTSSTWVKRTKQILRAAAHSADRFGENSRKTHCPDGHSLFAHLDPSQLNELKRLFPAWATAMVARKNAMLASEIFDDWPAIDVARYEPTSRAGSRASEPFSDLAFSEILRAALWLKSIQEDALRAYIATEKIRETDQGQRKHSLVQAFRRLSVERWESDLLKRGTEFPFWVQLCGRGMKSVRYEAWPLDTVLGLKRLLILCQCANAIIILAATGMRIGELISILRGKANNWNGDWVLSGWQFKEADRPSGDVRHWPMPIIAREALEAQERLAEVFSPGDTRLWVQFSGTKNVDAVPALQSSLRNFGRIVGLHDGRCLADLDGEISPHRFRYSVARLVALTMSGASQILFDVLGHRDIDVTLGYALRDPELHEEINRIRSEVKALRAAEIFDESEGLGGRAGSLVRRVKADYLSRSAEAALKTEDMAQAAAILGDAEIVREGVLCTAQPLERGACSSSSGLRDHGSCTAECIHRLETAAYVADRRKKVDSILSMINQESTAMQVFYRNQLFANFVAEPRFIEEFGRDERLLAVLQTSPAEELRRLPDTLRARLQAKAGVALSD